ncbi:MAG TPA: hypothetical protein VK572_10040 [Burkholderiales bacterium]|nr:hypothetical protein [Burkholderiales bacterium]
MRTKKSLSVECMVCVCALLLAACGGDTTGGSGIGPGIGGSGSGGGGGGNGGAVAAGSSLALFAGDNTASAGSNDGTGTAARFSAPTGIATDIQGNVFVADSANETIREITPSVAGGIVTTLSGVAGETGSTDTLIAAPHFFNPGGVATDTVGNLYVADSLNGTIRKIVVGSGVVTTLAGTAGTFGNTDDTGGAATFEFPLGVGTDSAHNVYVADFSNNNIRKVTPAGVVSTLAGPAGDVNVNVTGTTDANGTSARFDGPSGVAVDSTGNVFVADTGNNTIRKITPAGDVTTFAGSALAAGSSDGTGTAARFLNPRGLAIDSLGNLYVADSGNGTIRKITPTGVVTTIAGVAGQQGFQMGTLPGRLNAPVGVAVSGTSLYVVISILNCVVVLANRP